jgi:hypothetical protein
MKMMKRMKMLKRMKGMKHEGQGTPNNSDAQENMTKSDC